MAELTKGEAIRQLAVEAALEMERIKPVSVHELLEDAREIEKFISGYYGFESKSRRQP